MGFGDFLMKKSRQMVPGVSMHRLKAAESFDKAWLDDPLFRDLIACAGQLANTDLDISRLGSRSYLKRIGGNKMTLKDKNIRSLFDALEVDTNKLSEDGYITGVVRKLIGAEKSAKNNGEHGLATNTEQAVRVCCMVLAQHILKIYPDYAQRLTDIAPALKEAAK